MAQIRLSQIFPLPALICLLPLPKASGETFHRLFAYFKPPELSLRFYRNRGTCQEFYLSPFASQEGSFLP
ncbi:MAG: hypothetical protein AMS15_09015 [Planctomycetes bacterium DG_23]|nr:MAG: hypothetical protein AMS15_09015 [Planctomycetes bacterium DG_23]